MPSNQSRPGAVRATASFLGRGDYERGPRDGLPALIAVLERKDDPVARAYAGYMRALQGVPLR